MYTAQIQAMRDTYSLLYSETRSGVQADWEKVYRNLLRQGRIWDFSDLFLALWNTNGIKKTEKMLFGERSIFKVVLTDWSAHEGDGSTLLALLDILAHLMIQSPANKEITPFLEACLLLAHDIGESIMKRLPDGIPLISAFLSISLFARKYQTGHLQTSLHTPFGSLRWL